MNWLPWVIGGVIGIIVGGVIAGLLAKLRRGDAVSRVKYDEAARERVKLEERVSQLEQRRQELSGENRELDERLDSLERQKAATEATLKAERNNLAEQRRLLDEAEKKLKDAFNALAAEALGKTSESFLKNAEAKLKGTTEPLTEKLEQYRQLTEKIRREYGGVDKQLDKLDKQTRLLVDALKRPQVSGRWGESTLRRLVELAGMSEYCDFDEQFTVTGEQGRLRPDMVVRLPNERVIVIDAKTSGDHYLKALEADSDEGRAAAMTEYARTVKDRLTELSRKGYTEMFEHTPEFVVQFLPNEAYFVAALEVNPKLIEYGWENGVMLASPTTLMSLLLAVAQGWREDRLKDTVELIAKEGAELYDRLCVMGGHVVDLGKKLNGAVSSYDDFVGSVEVRLLPSARRLRELSAVSNKPLPEMAPLSRRSRVATAPELQAGSSDKDSIGDSGEED
ncbi:MAG: DNA recombination protein RmuC [Candidatus Coatesbacteria bacterium]|nr:DNA recombination protein RmuC [Candidatus Coatesbacteria bacterium]